MHNAKSALRAVKCCGWSSLTSCNANRQYLPVQSSSSVYSYHLLAGMWPSFLVPVDEVELCHAWSASTLSSTTSPVRGASLEKRKENISLISKSLYFLRLTACLSARGLPHLLSSRLPYLVQSYIVPYLNLVVECVVSISTHYSSALDWSMIMS